MTSQERFDAASVNLGSAVQGLLDKVKSFGVLDNADTELAKAKAEIVALQAAHDEALDRVSVWAEGIVAEIGAAGASAPTQG
jgi:hypothetical protein